MRALLFLALMSWLPTSFADQDFSQQIGCGDFRGEEAPQEFLDMVIEYYTEKSPEECPALQQHLEGEEKLYDAGYAHSPNRRRGRRHYRGPRHRYYPRPVPYPPAYNYGSGLVCRAGYYFCVMAYPGYLGTPCFCPGFNGFVSTH